MTTSTPPHNSTSTFNTSSPHASRQHTEATSEHLLSHSRRILERLPALGPIVLLYMQSPLRRLQFLADLEWLLMPPLMLGQCKLYMKKRYPISFASWALLDQAAEDRLTANAGRLRPEDWQSGDRPWLIDLVAPFGGLDVMLADLRRNEFPGKRLRFLAPDPQSGRLTPQDLPPWEQGADKPTERQEVPRS